MQFIQVLLTKGQPSLAATDSVHKSDRNSCTTEAVNFEPNNALAQSVSCSWVVGSSHKVAHPVHTLRSAEEPEVLVMQKEVPTTTSWWRAKAHEVSGSL